MGLFDSSMLLEENYQQSHATEIDSVPVDESYFSIAIKELNTINYNYYNMNKILCRSLLEAGDDRVLITESFDGFVDGIKAIIDKFLELIKKIFSRFNTFMHKLISSDKHLLKEKKLFQLFNGEDEFNIDIFRYTYLDDPEFPNPKPFEDETGIKFDEYEFSTAHTIDTKDFVAHMTSQYDNKKATMDSWYDGFRGKVIANKISSKEVSYSAAEFGTELYKVFRNGESSRTNETITMTGVLEALDRFENFDKNLKAVSKLKVDLEKAYKSIKDNCKSQYSKLADDNMPMFASKDNANVYYTAYNNADAKDKAKMDDQVKLIMKLEMDKIQSMCNIHSLAFSAKLDAIKEAYKQDKRLLYAALARVKKKHKDLYKESAEYLETVDATKIINLDALEEV